MHLPFVDCTAVYIIVNDYVTVKGNHFESLNMMPVFKLKVKTHALISLYQHYSHTCWIAGNHYHSLYKQLDIDMRGRLEDYEVWSKTMVNLLPSAIQRKGKGSSIREAARRTLIPVCGKFQLVRFSQSVVSCSWGKACFKMCRTSWITSNALIWNFDSNCTKLL